MLVFRRHRARHRLKDDLAVWYHPAYETACLAATARVPHLDVARGHRIIQRLREEKILGPGDVRSAQPADWSDLKFVHSDDYLQSTTRAPVLGHIFGVEPAIIDVDCALAAQRHAVGGTIAASEWAIQRAGRIAFQLGGGFHHAEADKGAGFCVYNDIAISIARLRRAGFSAPICIVDLDFHQGNGNLELFAADPSIFNYSIHGSTWTSTDSMTAKQILLPPGTGDKQYMAALRTTLPAVLEQHRPGLVFYVAGNDALAGDPLGTFTLSADGALARDRLVADLATDAGASMVITLAGGYSPDAWQVSCNFLRWLLTNDARSRISAATSVLSAVDDELSEQDLVDSLPGLVASERRFLDALSHAGVELALEDSGVLPQLRQRGFTDLKLEIDSRDRSRQRLRVQGTRAGHTGTLIELIVGRKQIESLDVLSIEWLLLADPSRAFSAGRPRLPGQEHPGLGLLGEVVSLLLELGQSIGVDAVAIVPSHYHIAYIARRHFHFLDPDRQKRFAQQCQALENRPLSQASELAAATWQPAPMIAPIAERLRVL